MSHIFTCELCSGETGPQDEGSMIDGTGVYCGNCTHRLDIDHGLILPCGLCRFPVLGTPHFIDDHIHEYCETCHGILILMGF